METEIPRIETEIVKGIYLTGGGEQHSLCLLSQRAQQWISAEGAHPLSEIRSHQQVVYETTHVHDWS